MYMGPLIFWNVGNVQQAVLKLKLICVTPVALPAIVVRVRKDLVDAQINNFISKNNFVIQG